MRFDLKTFLDSLQKPYFADFELDFSGFDFFDFTVSEPAHCSFSAEPVPEGASLSLSLTATVHAECARCLAPLQNQYSFQRAYLVKAQELDDPDFELPLTEKGLLDLDELAYQELVFEVPRVQLCSPDCLGLCPVCGKRKAAGCTCQPAGDAAPADARLGILKQLLS